MSPSSALARSLSAALVLLALSACTTKTVSVPSDEQVRVIEVRDVRERINLNPTDQPIRITDRSRITEIVGFLRERAEGWRRPWYTPPASDYTVVFRGEHGPLFVLWIGRDWIGGQRMPQGPLAGRFRKLGRAE